MSTEKTVHEAFVHGVAEAGDAERVLSGYRRRAAAARRRRRAAVVSVAGVVAVAAAVPLLLGQGKGRDVTVSPVPSPAPTGPPHVMTGTPTGPSAPPVRYRPGRLPTGFHEVHRAFGLDDGWSSSTWTRAGANDAFISLDLFRRTQDGVDTWLYRREDGTGRVVRREEKINAEVEGRPARRAADPETKTCTLSWLVTDKEYLELSVAKDPRCELGASIASRVRRDPRPAGQPLALVAGRLPAGVVRDGVGWDDYDGRCVERHTYTSRKPDGTIRVELLVEIAEFPREAQRSAVRDVGNGLRVAVYELHTAVLSQAELDEVAEGIEVTGVVPTCGWS